MANFVLNQSKGRAVEFYHRVENNDPAASALILVPLSASGTEAQGQDYDDLAALLGDANFTEAGVAWGRKTLTDAELAAPAPNDTDNRYDIAVPQVTWTAVAAGNDTTGLLVCYDADTAAGTDANIIVISHHDFVVTTDGNDVILNAGDFLRSS